MIPPRWVKVLKDLWALKIRTALVVLSIAVGVFAVGSVTSSNIILAHDMNADYQSANPHSGLIFCEQFDDDLVAAVRKIPGVEYAEGRNSWSGNIAVPNGKPVQISLIAIPKGGVMKIDTFRTLDGSPLPELHKNELMIDQSGLSLLPVKAGDHLQLQLSDQRQRDMTVVRVIHAPTAFSAGLSNSATGYINLETYQALTGTTLYSELDFTVSEQKTDEKHVKDIAQIISDKIEKSGRRVYATVVVQPGRHPAESVTLSLLTLMAGMGALTVFLSSFLVVNTISALLTQHTRQIGVMKSIGGRTGQIIGMYVVLVSCFGFLALLIAIPAASAVSFLLINFLKTFLNFEPAPYHIPPAALILELALAFLIPLGAAIGPVLAGARQTVREAISNYGIGNGNFGKNIIDRAVESIQGLPRPLLISLRNTFRRKARLVLTLSTLTLAGAIFIGVFNLKAALDDTIQETLGYFLSDINVTLNQMRRVDQIVPMMMALPAVEKVEPWGVVNSKIFSADKKTATEILIWGPPPGSTLIKPVMISGRWLLPEDDNAIVIGNHVLERRPDLKVGDQITTLINNRDYTWRIVGIFKMAGTVIPPFTYANNSYLSKISGTPDQAAYYRFKLNTKTAAEEQATADLIKRIFKAEGIPVGDVTTGSVTRAQQAVTTNILVYFLMFMALLIALVGGLGLSSTMSMNVIERTREIGVMRSIGASTFSILSMVLVEGMLIGGISWLFGIILSLPIGKYLGDIVGLLFVKVPLKFMLSADGFVIWLVIVTVLSTVASILPALNAARLTVRDVLAYE